MKLTELQKRALKIAPTLSRDGRFTCTMLGEALFAKKRFSEWNVYPLDMQRFARPAGKIIKALRAANKVAAVYNEDRRDPRMWYQVVR